MRSLSLKLLRRLGLWLAGLGVPAEAASPVKNVPTGALERSMLLFERLAPAEGSGHALVGELRITGQYPIVFDGLMPATSNENAMLRARQLIEALKELGLEAVTATFGRPVVIR